MVILDTCAIITLYHPQENLGKATLKKIESGACVLSVSFAEIALKVKQGKLILEPGVKKIYEDFLSLSHVSIVNIGVQEWLDAIELDWKHKDPADRLIVSYAQKHELPIVTSDTKIKQFFRNTVW